MATMRERQKAVQLHRGQIPSPGAPTIAWREDRVRREVGPDVVVWEGLTKPEIIRVLKRYVAREVWRQLPR